MFSFLRQIGAVARINVRSIPKRPGLSATTLLASAVVVAVLLAFLAMAQGFQRTVAGTGREDVAVVMKPGSQSELNSVITRDQARLLQRVPMAARTTDGRPLVSPEVFVIVDGRKKTTGKPVNVPLRGLTAIAPLVRADWRLVEGRMFEPGRDELVVGRAIADAIEGLAVGRTVRFGTHDWKIVGLFETGGSVYESEIWGDLSTVQNRFNRGGSVQVVRIALTAPERLEELQRLLDDDPNLKLKARSERAYLAELAQGTVRLIRFIGWPTAIIMAIGALAGALNTMYASVAARTREIGTLRAIGFSGLATFFGTMAESLLLAAAGGLLGSLGAWALFEGRSASTLGGSFTQIVFDFHLDAGTIATGVTLAILIGLVGGLFPAMRAARVPITAAFRTR